MCPTLLAQHLSKQHLQAELNVPRIRNRSSPLTERRAGNIGIKCLLAKVVAGSRQDVPIEYVEEFRPELYTCSFGDTRIFHHAEIFIVVTGSTQVRNPVATTEVKIERAGILESREIKKRPLVRIVVCWVLQERLHSWNYRGNAGDLELLGNITGARAEIERRSRCSFKDADDLPATDQAVQRSSSTQESLPPAKRQFIRQGERQTLRCVHGEGPRQFRALL